MNNSKRIIWIDNVKYICIMMVILSHLDFTTTFWKTIYLPFALTAFFFASGYVYNHKPGFKQFIYKKIRQLFIPWLVFSTLLIISSHIMSFNAHEGLVNELLYNLLQLRGHGDELWFVAAIFVAYIPFYFLIDFYEIISKKKGKPADSIVLIIALILSLISIVYTSLFPKNLFPWNNNVLPWHLEYIFQGMFFMLLGYLSKKHELSIKKIPAADIILVSIYFILVFLWPQIGIHANLFQRILFKYVSEILGVIMVCIVATYIPENQYITFVGQNTIIYFALHGKLYSLLQTVMKKISMNLYQLILSNEIYSSIAALLLAIIISIILIVPTLIINKWFPFVVGRTKPKQ